jgi:uncharacterized protein
MSHRIYLYNYNNTASSPKAEPSEGGFLADIIATIGDNSNDALLMMEWSYELPLFLHPLFTGNPYIAAPLYNGNAGGLYADAEPGIDALKAFYSFIDQHAEKLTANPEEFREQKEKIFNFFDKKARFSSFHLDAWDVFNMSDEPHEEQAEELLSLIRKTNACIQAAIEANDPLLLDECPDVLHNSCGFTSFKQLFSTDVYGYGWEVIRSGYYEEDDDEQQQIFMQNGLMGLKDADGNIIIPAEYDEVCTFPDGESLAVVKRDGKFGYVERGCKPVTELKYDDAYDTVNGYATVQTGTRHLLIQPGRPEPATDFDDLFIISEDPQLYGAGENGNYGVIDTTLQWRLPAMFSSDMEMLAAEEMPLLSAYHISGARHFYSPAFTRIGDDNTSNVTWAGTFNNSPLLCITQLQGNKKQKRVGLATTDGQILLPATYQEITHAYDDTVIVKNNGLYGLFAASKGWVLEMEYDRITSMANNGFLLNKSKKQGLYIPGQSLIPPMYDVIVANVRLGDTGSWETVAINTDAVFSIDHLGNMVQLTPEGIAEKLAPELRHLYNGKELKLLTTLAGDALPADLLYQKGFEAFNNCRYEEAIQLYTLAAQKGNADAMNDLGYLYESVEGYIDEKLSFEWYTRGVEAGSPHAANGLAYYYKQGINTAPDINKALELYEQSAAKHVSDAHYNLAMLYYEGIHVPEDAAKALDHFVYACRLGSNCHNYAGMLFEKTGNYKNAFDFYKDGTRYNDENCAFNLARMYEAGWGCKADPRKALAWFMKSVEWGAADAHLQLRRLYLYNDAVKDEAKAMEHERLAREAGLEVGE